MRKVKEAGNIKRQTTSNVFLGKTAMHLRFFSSYMLFFPILSTPYRVLAKQYHFTYVHKYFIFLGSRHIYLNISLFHLLFSLTMLLKHMLNIANDSMRYKFPLYLSMIIAIYGAAAEGVIKFDVYNIPFNILYEQYFFGYWNLYFCSSRLDYVSPSSSCS